MCGFRVVVLEDYNSTTSALFLYCFFGYSIAQMGTDKSGLGIGLTISRRAVSLNKGILSVRDVPHQGCVFSVDLPLASSPLP
ncbi:MAG: hypothetical protein ACYTXY_43695, partial [Nostoc sp.]